MSSRTFLVIAAILGALLAAFFTISSSPSPSSRTNFPGRNGTILFLSNGHHGLSNVLLATTQALLTEHFGLEIHYASFENLEKDIQAINQFALNSPDNEDIRPVTFHTLKAGPEYGLALAYHGIGVNETINKRGVEGISRFMENFGLYTMPWDAPDFLALYNEIMDLIEEINPAIVGVDPLLGPALNTVRTPGKERNYVVISPNSLKDNFQDKQPLGRMFWEYPALASGYPCPVPLHLIPANILLNFCIAVTTLFNKSLREKQAWMKQNGMEKPLSVFDIYHPDYMWISSSASSIDFPMYTLPDNVVACGPIYLSSAPAATQDPGLASWLQLRPTVIINLGSSVTYDEKSATEMISAIIKLLNDRPNIQVVWKFNKRTNVDPSKKSLGLKGNSTYPYSNDFLAAASAHLETGRLRLENWLGIDLAAMMETGNVILTVHHGGASCFHETTAKGVPQMILPMWVDLYDFAVRAEYLGIGVWANRDSAPLWTAKELTDAFERVLGDSEEAISIRDKAKTIGSELQRREEQGLGGRKRAASVVARLAKKG